MVRGCDEAQEALLAAPQLLAKAHPALRKLSPLIVAEVAIALLVQRCHDDPALYQSVMSGTLEDRCRHLVEFAVHLNYPSGQHEGGLHE